MGGRKKHDNSRLLTVNSALESRQISPVNGKFGFGGWIILDVMSNALVDLCFGSVCVPGKCACAWEVCMCMGSVYVLWKWGWQIRVQNEPSIGKLILGGSKKA